jgi:hypothetical protein
MKEWRNCRVQHGSAWCWNPDENQSKQDTAFWKITMLSGSQNNSFVMYPDTMPQYASLLRNTKVRASKLLKLHCIGKESRSQIS